MRVGVLTISDRAAAGLYSDVTGPAVVEVVQRWAGATVERSEVIADERKLIASRLREWATALDVILTNGGTGLSERDVTPEATADVVTRLVPGLSEMMRVAGQKSTPLAALSRGISGQYGHCLIINLPGSTKGAVEGVEVIADVVPHAVAVINGGDHQ